MSRFLVENTPIQGLRLITRQPMSDSRGWFERLYCVEELASATGLPFQAVQINRSFTRTPGTVRGMHFQRPPHSEIKMVSCIAGEVFDVTVDLRAGSGTYLRWFGARLSAENRRSLLIPRGFAHGFQTLTPDTELIYLHSAKYAPEAEDGLHPCDPALGIQWPLGVRELSSRDSMHPHLGPDFEGIAGVS